ncbi:hypothetical protein MC885_007385 [Smutsia gigantea]|nr:hypothetical protein MC885_007385 [Smutsia gigantea]
MSQQVARTGEHLRLIRMARVSSHKHDQNGKTIQHADELGTGKKPPESRQMPAFQFLRCSKVHVHVHARARARVCVRFTIRRNLSSNTILKLSLPWAPVDSTTVHAGQPETWCSLSFTHSAH